MTTYRKVQYVVEEVEAPAAGEPNLPYGSKLGSPGEVGAAFAGLAQCGREEIWAAHLDAKQYVVSFAQVSVGTLTSSLVHPREVFGPALAAGAVQVVCAHNHPSGDPTPSEADIETTRRLHAAGKMLGIQLLDHVVIGANGTFRSIRNAADIW